MKYIQAPNVPARLLDVIGNLIQNKKFPKHRPNNASLKS